MNLKHSVSEILCDPIPQAPTSSEAYPSQPNLWSRGHETGIKLPLGYEADIRFALGCEAEVRLHQS